MQSVAQIFIQGRFKLQFEINGKQYFLAFVDDERRWYVFSATQKGVERIPVYVDAVKYESFGIGSKNTTNVTN